MNPSKPIRFVFILLDAKPFAIVGTFHERPFSKSFRTLSAIESEVVNSLLTRLNTLPLDEATALLLPYEFKCSSVCVASAPFGFDSVEMLFTQDLRP
jgi:hypothetical protein